MISITQKGLTILDKSLIGELKNEFARKHCIILPKLVEEKLLEKILNDLDTASFYENEHLSEENKVFATDMTIHNKNLALHQINFLLNNDKLFRLIEEITGCEQILGFTSRIYRNMPGTDHHLDWHDDTIDKSRLIALSMNLSKEKFEGGVFQIRRKGSEQLLREVACGNLGDTHVFNVSPELQHRVTKTAGKFPRTAAAGWFTSKPALSPFKQNK